MTAAKRLKRWLYLSHRWLGIATALLFALWIASGLVLLHVPFPRLIEAERLARLAPIDWTGVTVSPDAALAAAPAHPHRPLALEMRGPEPVYRITAADGARLTVSARTGERLGPVSAEEAQRLAGATDGARVAPVARDQWTVTARYDPLRPFHKVALGDAAGTELYVSERTGEIALDTTRFERGWNWVGAIVHWVYPLVLRARPDLWRDVVLWLSAIAIAGAVSGLVVGSWRVRLRRRYPHGQMTPYRGLARWHHLFGLAAGLFLTTYIVSGWLSMNPNRWFSSPTPPEAWLAAYAGQQNPVGLDTADLKMFPVDASGCNRFSSPLWGGGRRWGWCRMRRNGAFGAIPTSHPSPQGGGEKPIRSTGNGTRRLAQQDARRFEFSRVAGRWLIAIASPQGTRVLGADGGPVPDEGVLVAAAQGLVPDGTLASVERIAAYDSYWYPQGEPPPLPVLRLRYDDHAATWLHIDPASGAILNRLDASGRANRWLFDALHRLDLPLLIENPRARTLVQWLLSLLIGVIALTGLIAGWRRLGRMLT